MSLLRRFLGVDDAAMAASGSGETESVRRIAAKLERLGHEKARFVAAFSYVLARVANADLVLDPTEAQQIERAVRELGGLAAEEARVVREIACEQSERIGGSENYVVTREFRRIASRDERARLIVCLFALAAADGEISTAESREVLGIAEELGFTRPEALAVRATFREHVAELKVR